VLDADLDTLLIALYVELDDRIIPTSRQGRTRRGPGRPPLVTDAELLCLAVAQVLLRFNDEHHWLRAAPARVGHLLPRLLKQSEYNERLKNCANLLEAALRWLADRTPGSAEPLRLMDATPIGCGQSPKLAGEREQTRQTLTHAPVNQPEPGTIVVTDKGLAGAEVEEFFADLDLTLVRPARRDEKTPRPFPNWLRQRIEAIIWALKKQLGLEHHNARVPAGLWTRILQRLLALNAVIWHNWTIGAPVKRSLIAYDH
jgi:hypothetical protein